MRIHALKTLKLFWTKYPDAEIGLKYWYSKIEAASYKSPVEIISEFKGADYVGNERIVFNISKNKFRIIAAFNYEYQLCFIKFVGTHKEYDFIDAKNVEYK
jgi:mRNA interferase HigB